MLISPLWATRRYGCASGQLGKVLVEKRECTRPKALTTRSSCRSSSKAAQLRSRQHALADKGAPGQAREVDGVRRLCAAAGALAAELVLDTLTYQVRPALQFVPARTTDEHLAERRHRIARQCADRRIVDRDVAPTEHGQAQFADDLVNALDRRVRIGTALRQEGDTGGVGAFRRQLEVHDGGRKKASGIWIRMPAPSPVFGSAPAAPPVLQVHQRGDRLFDDVTALAAVHVDDERDAARVVFESRIVETDGSRSTLHGRPLHLLRCATLSTPNNWTVGESPSQAVRRVVNVIADDSDVLPFSHGLCHDVKSVRPLQPIQQK